MVSPNSNSKFSFPFHNENENDQILDEVKVKTLNSSNRFFSVSSIAFFVILLLLIVHDSKQIDNTSSDFQSMATTPMSIAQSVEVEKNAASLNLENEETYEIEKNIINTPVKKEEKNLPVIVDVISTEKVQAELPVIVDISPVAKVLVEKTIESTPKSEIELPIEKINSTKKAVEVKKVKSTLEINHDITMDLLPLDYHDAMTNAKINDKKVLIKFGAKWCLPCKQMEKTTFADTKVKNYLEANYVVYDVNVEDLNQFNIKAYYNVRLLPTLLFLEPNGVFIEKHSKYLSIEKMLDILNSQNALPIESKTVAQSDINETILEQPDETLVIEKIPTIKFNEVILKKSKSGKPISNLRAKAKNWRYTNIDFSVQNITEGYLFVKVKETGSGKILSNQKISLDSNGPGITDSTTTFQLDVPIKKKKKKSGNYELEIYHSANSSLTLIGNQTIVQDGNILY